MSRRAVSALANTNQLPVSLLLAFVIVTPPQAKVGIPARLRKSKKLRVGLRRSFRAFASRFFRKFSHFHNDLSIQIAIHDWLAGAPRVLSAFSAALADGLCVPPHLSSGKRILADEKQLLAILPGENLSSGPKECARRRVRKSKAKAQERKIHSSG